MEEKEEKGKFYYRLFLNIRHIIKDGMIKFITNMFNLKKCSSKCRLLCEIRKY